MKSPVAGHRILPPVRKMNYLAETVSELLSHLRGKVFHVTSRTKYEAILTSGGIMNNRDGSLGINSSSKHSYGRLKGYVCLFDLRNIDEKTISEVLGKYNFLRPAWFGKMQPTFEEWNLTYLLLAPNKYQNLIPYEAACHDIGVNGNGFLAIRKAEAWIPERIPLEWIETIYNVEVICHAPPVGTFRRFVWDGVAKQSGSECG